MSVITNGTMESYPVRLLKGADNICEIYTEKKMIARDQYGKFARKYKSPYNHNIYDVWRGMHRRCKDTRAVNFDRYGGRGITVCSEWENYDVFVEWAMANNWKPGLQIDRIDNSGPYEPANCRFVSPKENSNNRRSTKFYTFNGKTQSLKAWAEEYGINYGTLRTRILEFKWGFEEALTVPAKVGQKYQKR